MTRRHILFIAIFFVLGTLFFFAPSHSPVTLKTPIELPIIKELETSVSVYQPRQKFLRDEHVVASGDTLEVIFDKFDLRHELLGFTQDYPQFNTIMPRQKFVAYKGFNKRLLKLEYFPSSREKQTFSRDGQGKWHVEKNDIDFVTRLKFVHGTIKNSLYVDGLELGMDDALIANLTEIFAWDIDFYRQVRSGDSFKVIFRQVWDGQQWVSTQEIQAAEFLLGRERYTAFRYEYKNRVGYFDRRGNNLRKAFTRNPVKNPRITSRFNPRRKHPILHKIRFHKGVDYGAVVGTPIFATGDGVVSFQGWKNGYGKTLIIKHGKIYTTLFAHMSRFNSRARVGNRIRQGQVIGYVGKTGRVTGPHLHYEFRINNRHTDPLKVRLPTAQPIASDHLQLYRETIKPYEEKLRLMDVFPFDERNPDID